LFVTNDDMVYGMGSNCRGSLGLGHNLYVNEIQVIDRLCHKNITQFFNGVDLVLGFTHDNCLYVWGKKDAGQFGMAHKIRSLIRRTGIFWSQIIDNKSINQISCGNSHTMVLTSDGCVYGWGHNMFGQLGCGPDRELRNRVTCRVNFNPNHEIKSIYCCDYSSFAITSKGQVLVGV